MTLGMYFLSFKGEMVISFSNSKIAHIYYRKSRNYKKEKEENENSPLSYHLEITSADLQ